MPAKRIGVFVGSLRKESLNRKVAHALSALAPEGMAFEFFEIGNLPLYNQDLDENPPEPWVRFRDRLKPMDGVLFVTPEYNRSIPGVLKNAIDIGSRPYGESAWDGKPGAVISASPGATGGFGANHHLRQCLVFLNIPCMQQPEAYIGHADVLWGEQGEVKKDSTREFLKAFVHSFAAWVDQISSDKSKRSAAA
jgi:chromate reductase